MNPFTLQPIPRLLPFVYAITAAFAGSATAAPIFTPGNLVVSVVGNVDGSTKYGDNQATPIKLQELTTTGKLGASLVLPQTTTVINGKTRYAVSGEYGSSSEGLLHRSADGLSLVIAGYGVNAATYNAGGAAVYGDARLAQSTSLTTSTTFTPVARVLTDISINGNVDSTTGLFNVFNGNNPRSVATVDGSSFYVAGQGLNSTDTKTQGVFYAQDGASSATQITGASNYRSVSIQNGQLYASRDYNPPKGSTDPKAAEVDRFASALPTTASTPTAVIGATDTPGEITVTAGATNNGVNDARVGLVYLSPEDYFLASDTIMYVADSGFPKNGSANAAGLGDGGLQKWQLVNGTWMLMYDIYAGLKLVNNAGTSGTVGLIGLTGQVVNGTTYLYATNSTIGDLDQTYVFSVFDPLSQTTRGAQTNSDIFTTIYTAAAGTNVRGIAFAPVPEPATIALTTIGFAGLLAAGRRRRR